MKNSLSSTHDEHLRSVCAYIESNKNSSLYRGRLEGIDVSSITQNDLGRIKSMRVSELRQHEGTLLHVPESEARYLVSEFTDRNADALFLLGERRDTRWKTLEASIAQCGITGAVLAVSRNWQLGARFFETCRESAVPSTVFSHRDVPYIARLIEEVGVDLVITTPDVAHAVYTLLREKGVEKIVKSWILIIELGIPKEIPRLTGTAIVEHHVFPGIAVGVSTDGQYMAPSNEYFVEIGAAGVYITSLEKHAVPLLRLFLPGVTERGRQGGRQSICFIAEDRR